MNQYAKAIIGALTAGLSAVGVALTNDGHISATEWVVIAGAVLAGLGLVWGVPNAPATPKE